MRSFAILIAGLMPHSSLKMSLLRMLGWSVGVDVRIAPSILWRIGKGELGDAVSIGFGNVVRNITTLRIDSHSLIGQWNWISAATEFKGLSSGVISIGSHSSVTSRHYIDCSGGVFIGSFTTIAGCRSTFITHGIRWTTSEQRSDPIHIGNYALISSNVCLAPKSVVGDRSVVAMGSTVRGSIPASVMYSTSSTPLIKKLTFGKYFSRSTGYVSVSVEDDETGDVDLATT